MARSLIFKAFWGILLTIAVTTIVSTKGYAEELALPSGDLIAPKIEHSELPEHTPGEPLTLSATVTDNRGLDSVILFFRTKGEPQYSRTKMTALSGTHIFSATLAAYEIDSPGLDYYIQATDLAGNTVLLGYSFSPLSINIKGANGVLTPEGNQQLSQNIPAKEKTPLLKNKWFWVAVAAVVVGAAAAGGGSSGDGDTAPRGSGPDDSGEVTITVPLPE